MAMSLDDRIAATVRIVVDLLVARRYDDLVALSSGVRLNSGEIERGVAEYQATLVAPPRSAFDDIDVIKVSDLEPDTYSVWTYLYTEEEGMSDLSIRLTLIDKDSNEDTLQVEIDDILVP